MDLNLSRQHEHLALSIQKRRQIRSKQQEDVVILQKLKKIKGRLISLNNRFDDNSGVMYNKLLDDCLLSILPLFKIDLWAVDSEKEKTVIQNELAKEVVKSSLEERHILKLFENLPDDILNNADFVWLFEMPKSFLYLMGEKVMKVNDIVYLSESDASDDSTISENSTSSDSWIEELFTDDDDVDIPQYDEIYDLLRIISLSVIPSTDQQDLLIEEFARRRSLAEALQRMSAFPYKVLKLIVIHGTVKPYSYLKGKIIYHRISVRNRLIKFKNTFKTVFTSNTKDFEKLVKSSNMFKRFTRFFGKLKPLGMSKKKKKKDMDGAYLKDPDDISEGLSLVSSDSEMSIASLMGHRESACECEDVVDEHTGEEVEECVCDDMPKNIHRLDIIDLLDSICNDQLSKNISSHEDEVKQSSQIDLSTVADMDLKYDDEILEQVDSLSDFFNSEDNLKLMDYLDRTSKYNPPMKKDDDKDWNVDEFIYTFHKLSAKNQNRDSKKNKDKKVDERIKMDKKKDKPKEDNKPKVEEKPKVEDNSKEDDKPKVEEKPKEEDNSKEGDKPKEKPKEDEKPKEEVHKKTKTKRWHFKLKKIIGRKKKVSKISKEEKDEKKPKHDKVKKGKGRLKDSKKNVGVSDQIIDDELSPEERRIRIEEKMLHSLLYEFSNENLSLGRDRCYRMPKYSAKENPGCFKTIEYKKVLKIICKGKDLPYEPILSRIKPIMFMVSKWSKFLSHGRFVLIMELAVNLSYEVWFVAPYIAEAIVRRRINDRETLKDFLNLIEEYYSTIEEDDNYSFPYPEESLDGRSLLQLKAYKLIFTRLYKLVEERLCLNPLRKTDYAYEPQNIKKRKLLCCVPRKILYINAYIAIFAFRSGCIDKLPILAKLITDGYINTIPQALGAVQILHSTDENAILPALKKFCGPPLRYKFKPKLNIESGQPL